MILSRLLPPSSLQTHCTLLQKAFEEQNAIGWDQAIQGYLSTTWVEAYRTEHPKTTIMGARNQWLKQIILALWKLSATFWETRNTQLHSTTTATTAICHSAIDSRVRSLYSQQHEFAASDRTLFDTPLAQHLIQPLRSKKHWLTLVARYHPTSSIRKMGNQRLITKFYRRPDVPIPIPPAPNILRPLRNSASFITTLVPFN